MRIDRYSCTICKFKDRGVETVEYGGIVECDMRVDVVFTVA